MRRDDLYESTFTLSNIGSIGIDVSAFPIIPSPQVCIGVLSRIHRVVVAVQTDKSAENFSRKYEGNFNNHDFERKYIR